MRTPHQRTRRAASPGSTSTRAARAIAEFSPVVGGLDASEVLKWLRDIPHPVRRDELLHVLDLSRRDKKALDALLYQMEAEGRVLRLQGGRWIEASQAVLVTGVLSVQRSGVGFVTPDTEPRQRVSKASANEDTSDSDDIFDDLDTPPSSKDTRRTGRSASEQGRPSRGQGKRALSADIFIPAHLLGDAWHGDRVEVAVTPPRAVKKRQHGRSESTGRGGRAPEGRILRVLEHRHTEVVVHATTRRVPEGLVCRAADPRLDVTFLVDITALAVPPQRGELLLITPGEKLEERVWSGVARQSLGNESDAAVQERLVKLNHEIPLEFPPNVQAEAETLAPEWSAQGMDLDGLPQLDDLAQAPAPEQLPTSSTAVRQDLRGVPFVTIDGDDARDFDDAVYAMPVQRGNVCWELWVAIADVSHFVRTGSALDREAKERGNSYYFPSSVEPMLPEVLSNGLCSLRPHEDRLVMAARIGFDAQGFPQSAAFFPGLIRSRARLTYTQVHATLELLEQPQAAQTQAEQQPLESAVSSQEAEAQAEQEHERARLEQRQAAERLLAEQPALRDAATLARLLQARRQARGSLDFDLPEAQFIVDKTSGNVVDVCRRERFFSHRLIEEFMLAANEAVARFLTERRTPFPYRIHPAPDPDRLATLFRTLGATGLAVTKAVREAKPSPAALRGILANAEGTPQEYLVGRLVLRSMMQARYAPDQSEHFGLASPCYCHFTSPIRRYADLMVHRALRCALGGAHEAIPAGKKLLAIADQCNARERAATEAEREIARRLGCLLLRDRAGEVFSGVISGVTEYGFYVEFDAMPLEGMVRLTTLQHDWFSYDADRQELLGAGTGQRFRLGQAVTVRLVDVHVGRLEINLELQGDRPMGKGKRRPAQRDTSSSRPLRRKSSRRG